jgi:hypothetical protein
MEANAEIRRLLDSLRVFILQEKNMQRLTRYQDDVLTGIANDMSALLALPADLPPTEARQPLNACGYCGSPLHVEGDVLHRVDCNRPVPREDDTPDD